MPLVLLILEALLARPGYFTRPDGYVLLAAGLAQAWVTQLQAGRSRWLGRRPLTRGVAKNPVDHPHGGGEGRTSGGRHPVTPWGKPTKGARTRHNKSTDKMIIRSRHAKKKR